MGALVWVPTGVESVSLLALNEHAHTANIRRLPSTVSPLRQAAQALLREEMSHLSGLSKALPGYSIRLAGHSLGAGVAAVVTYLLNSR